MDTKRDLQEYKNKLMELSYNEKIEMSEWLHTQIEFEMGQAVKQKGKEVTQQFENFVNKAAAVTKTAGNDMLNAFRNATHTHTGDNNTGENTAENTTDNSAEKR